MKNKLAQNLPLILLHGALGSKDQFNATLPYLENLPEVHAFTFEGHGGIPTTRPFRMANFAENVNAFIRENQLDQVNIFGYSMGGYVALEYARQFPKRVKGIMTLGTKFDWTPESAAKELKYLNPQKIEEKIPAFASLLSQRHAPLDWKMVMEQTAEMMTHLGGGGAFSLSDIKTISANVVIALGDQDNMVNTSESQAIVDALPNATFLQLPNCPHPIEKVNPQQLAMALTQVFYQ